MNRLCLVATVLLTACVYSLCPLTADGKDEASDAWSTTLVPAVAGEQDVSNYFWYRCYVKTPDAWAAESTSVYTETVSLAVEHLTDAHEAYVNGVKIGGEGMPPSFRSTREETNKYKIPKGILKSGQYNVIALRVYSSDGPGGFKGRAPIMAGYFQECILKGKWEHHLGDNPAWATTAQSERPSQAVFETFTDATSALRRPEKFIHGKKMPPAESLKTMRPADDLEIDLLLAEPIVAQPLSLRFDERGRLWITQYRQYPYPKGLNMVSRDKFYRAVYDKVPLAPPNHIPGEDRITVHEDTNNDGLFDKNLIFVDGLNIATSALPGRGGVWVLNPPYLLFYPDADGDCVPDGDPVVHLEGFGLEDVHSAVNNLTWGPDGWLYAAQGSTVSSHISVQLGPDSKKAKQDDSVYCEGAAIWRYHPETHEYEIFAEGGGNAFGVEIDSQGRIYSGHNGSDTRGFYYVQGCYYTKSNEAKYGTHSNLYSFGMLNPMAATTPLQRFSHAFVKYEGTTLPKQYQGKLFSVDPLHRNVVISEKMPTGSSYTTNDIGFAVETEDISFRPVAISVGPDGAVYVADFCEEFIAHGQNYQGQIDPTSGRIFRLRAKGKESTAKVNLAEKNSNELVELLGHESKWFRQTALRLLAESKDASVIPKLRKNIATEKGQLALESFWALYQLGGFNSATAIQTLGHANPSVRRWAVRLLGDQQQLITSEVIKQLVLLAKNDPDVEVRCQLASTAKRLPASACLPIVRQLLTHHEDATDPTIPMIVWWALESTVDDPSGNAVDLFADAEVWKSPLVTEVVAERLMRRYATAGTRSNMLSAAKLLEFAPDKGSQEKLMLGFEKAFKGRSLSGIPAELAAQLSKVGGGSLTLMIRQGDKGAVDKALALLASGEADVTQQIEIVEVLGEVKYENCMETVLGVFETTSDISLRNAALIALQSYDSPIIARKIIELINKLPTETMPVAISTLASRASWSNTLLEAVDQGRIDKEVIPLESVRRMTMHSNETIGSLVSKHWQSLEGKSNQQMKAQMQRIQQLLAKGGGSPYAGREIFLETCAKCHLLFGKGGRIGPDLTAYKRDDTATMLLNIVNPSAEVREGFETYLVLTDEGRAISGFLYDQDQRVIVLRGTDGQNVTISRDTIEEMVRQPISLMPEDLLGKMTDQQIRDLFAYLRTSQPIAK